jgi:amidase
MVPMAHATDGGGSIRVPASHCGVVGLKPTRQRISQGPMQGDYASGLVCELVVSRSVRDTAAILDAVHGPAPGDPYVAPPPTRPYVDELEAGSEPLRIGLATTSAARIEIDPAVIPAATRTGELLESLGHTIEERSLADLAGGRGDELVDSFMTRWMAGKAATLDQLGVVVGRKLGPDDVEPLTWALAEEGWRRTSADYLAAVGRHHMVTRLIAAQFEAGLDLLLTPAVGEPPPPLGSYDDSGPDPLDAIRRAWVTAAFSGLFNATGNPAISLPLHWTDDGLPVGAQFVAPHGREDVLLRVAAQLEQASPWAHRVPAAFAAA